VDSQVHSLCADLKSLSTHDDSLALPLSFPRLERLSFDRAAASECSSLLLQLAVQQSHLLAHLQELDLSSCKVSLMAHTQDRPVFFLGGGGRVQDCRQQLLPVRPFALQPSLPIA
jgi:hypothetical protein